jgi:NAD(P)-dependent dehydrogenase (short-subunit alcohol dehydrogenase family)
MKLQGKTALVTGVSPNITGGIAEGLAADGAKTVCVDINPDYVHGCARSIAKQGGQAMGLVCDVTDEAQVIDTVARAEGAYGVVDILVNGATVFNFKGVLDMPLEEWRRQTDIHLTGAFLFTKHVAQRMIDQGRRGNIINIISTAGHQGEPGNVAYGTSKGGLLNFTRSVATSSISFPQPDTRVSPETLPTAPAREDCSTSPGRWQWNWPSTAFG